MHHKFGFLFNPFNSKQMLAIYKMNNMGATMWPNNHSRATITEGDNTIQSQEKGWEK